MMETKSLAAALAKAQGEMKNAVLNKTNPHFKSKFADLAAVRDATIPALTSNGLSIVQFTKIQDGTLSLITRLMHDSGEVIEGEYPLPAINTAPQQMGSALTYAKRYCWSAMCGIAADEDDDAEAAQQAPATETKAKNIPAPTGTTPALVKADGNLKITELKARVTALGREVQACSDADELTGLLSTPEAMETMTLAEKHLPSWWFGVEGEGNGLKNLIDSTRAGFATQIAAE